jgi:hypothetical protein
MKLLGLFAVVGTVLLGTASLAEARPDFRCNGVFEGRTYDDVVVPRGGACTLIGARIKGNVTALRNGYLHATNTRVRGDVEGSAAQTIFIDAGSRVGGSIEADRAAQFFVFNSTVGEDIEPERTREVVQICGNTVREGNIEVRRSGPDKSRPVAERPGTDILIGDPLTAGCRGNVVKRGHIKVVRNFTDVEFVIRGNRIRRGNLEVLGNTGPVTRFVEQNTGGRRLRCRQNGLPLTAAGNTGWDRVEGQCAAPAG